MARVRKGKPGYDRDSDAVRSGPGEKSYGPVYKSSDTPGVDELLSRSWKGSGCNVRDSRLNSGGDMKFRGRRGNKSAPAY